MKVSSLSPFIKLNRFMAGPLGKTANQLMVQKSGDHQLKLIVYPIIYHGGPLGKTRD